MIGQRLRSLRKQRRWSQAALAERLGLSQPKLSQVERGNASLTAEQLLSVLQLFNVGVDYFSTLSSEGGAVLQNALARYGASHLAEVSTGALEVTSDPNDVVFEVLVAAESPRHLAALAPVLIWSADRLSLPEVASRLLRVGRAHRLGWLLDSTLEAMTHARPTTLQERRRVQRAKLLIESFVETGGLTAPNKATALDLLDRDVRTAKTAKELWEHASQPARRWRIATRLQPDDFLHALRSAHESR